MDTELIFIMKYYNLYIVLFYKFVKKNFKKLKKISSGLQSFSFFLFSFELCGKLIYFGKRMSKKHIIILSFYLLHFIIILKNNSPIILQKIYY